MRAGVGAWGAEESFTHPGLPDSQPPHSRDGGWQIVPTGQRPRRVEDGPAHLNVDEDDLYVFRFEEPLQGLHEVLWERGEG